jgi:hypothetical protein
MILNECQTSDMVLIGILSRVRPFTWREDLKQEIKTTDAWNTAPFHFRLYPGTFSSNLNGAMTHVMMVEVDRPNINKGLKFFQDTFDGENKVSRCNIPYLFFCLYKNSLTDAERKQIIYNNELYISHTGIVHVQGFKDIDTVVMLQQNIKVKLRKFLLSLCAPNMSNGKIFVQIERQNEADWLTCAFHTTDANIVAENLHTTAPTLSKCIIPEDHDKVFSDPSGKLRFITKSIPIKKGNIRVASKPIDADTQAHTTKMLSKLAAQMKRPILDAQPRTVSVNMTSGSVYKKVDGIALPPQHIAIPTGHDEPDSTAPRISNPSEVERRFTLLEQNVLQSSERMDRLEGICTQLMRNTEMIGNQIQQLASEMYNSDSSRQPKPNKAAKLS